MLPSSLSNMHNLFLHDQDQTSLLVHVIQCRIQVRPGHFIVYKQSQSHLTWTKCDLVDPVTQSSFEP